MVYAFQLMPHPNARYQAVLEKLSLAELRSQLDALRLQYEVHIESLGGAPFFLVDTRELTGPEKYLLSFHSSLYLWAVREGQALLPLDKPDTRYVPGDLAELLKYKGKTNAAFTTMMLNMARCASAFAQAEGPLTVLDPMCGKGTTLYCALQQGMNGVGLDVDRKDLKEAMDFLERYFQLGRYKHALTQTSRTLQKGLSVPEAAYTMADTPEHYKTGDVRTLRLLLGDARNAGALLKKAPADLLVCDLPYGIQHAPTEGAKATRFEDLIRGCVRSWHGALKPGGAMALSFNTHTLKKADLAAWCEQAGFTPLLSAPYLDLEHYVEQAVTRDVLICTRA